MDASSSVHYNFWHPVSKSFPSPNCPDIYMVFVLQTFSVNGLGLSWPLGPIVPCLSLVSYVWNYWADFVRSRAEVMKNFEMACDALSWRLGKEEYFFKSRCCT